LYHVVLQYDDEALKLFRVAVLDKRRKMHLLNESEVSKRWNFEEGVRLCCLIAKSLPVSDQTAVLSRETVGTVAIEKLARVFGL
jgi:hypothetical protein